MLRGWVQLPSGGFRGQPESGPLYFVHVSARSDSSHVRPGLMAMIRETLRSCRAS